MFCACFLFCCGRRGVLPISLLCRAYLCGAPGGRVCVCVCVCVCGQGHQKQVTARGSVFRASSAFGVLADG